MVFSKIRKFLPFLAFILGVVLIIHIIVQLRIESVKHTKFLFYPRVNKERATALFSSLDTILQRPEDIYLIIGASSIEGFFDPVRFEKFLKPHSQAYNLGFRSIGPDHLEALARRLQFEMKKKNRTAETIYVRLETTRLTKRFETTEKIYNSEPRFYSAVYNTKMLKEDFLNKPGRVLRLLLDWYVFSKTSFYDIKDYVESLYILQNKPDKKNYFQIWVDPIYNDPVAWDIKTNGLYGWNKKNYAIEFESSLKNLNQPTVFDYSLKYFEWCCDIKNLVISNNLLQEFVNSLKTLKGFSKRVVVFYYPEDKSNQFQKPEAIQNLQTVKDAIEQVGVTYLDLSKHTNWEPDDYVDILHLSHKGLDKLYKKLISVESNH